VIRPAGKTCWYLACRLASVAQHHHSCGYVCVMLCQVSCWSAFQLPLTCSKALRVWKVWCVDHVWGHGPLCAKHKATCCTGSSFLYDQNICALGRHLHFDFAQDRAGRHLTEGLCCQPGWQRFDSLYRQTGSGPCIETQLWHKFSPVVRSRGLLWSCKCSRLLLK